MKRRYKYVLILLLLSCLVIVRAYENKLFYDPFIVFFQNDYLYGSIPDFEYLKLFWNLFIRYFINSVLSIGIIYFVFQKSGYVALSMKLYAIGFFVLSFTYLLLLLSDFSSGYLLPFYIRRFLIHPLFLLLLLAALFYEKLKDSAET